MQPIAVSYSVAYFQKGFKIQLMEMIANKFNFLIKKVEKRVLFLEEFCF